VALCDVNEKHLAFGAKKFPGAKQYVDWRKCLDQKDIDAVVCCSADHTHAFVANWAMNRGKAYLLREAARQQCGGGPRGPRQLSQEQGTKLATQVGTQRHEYENFNRVRGNDPGRGDWRVAGGQRVGRPAASQNRAICPPRASRPPTSTGTCGSARRPRIPGIRNTSPAAPA